MKDIASISKKLWKLVVRLLLLVLRLSKQVVLPNRKRKGNLLSTLFLFYIGAIEDIQHFEHRRFKVSDFFQNRFVRKGLMLFSFLLFFLTSYEQPIVRQCSFNETAKTECVFENTANRSCHDCVIKAVPIDTIFFATRNLNYCHSKKSEPLSDSSKRYLRNCRLLIWLNNLSEVFRHQHFFSINYQSWANISIHTYILI